MTDKQTKAKAIEQSLLAIADFYSVPASHVICPDPRKGVPLQNARNAFMFHLRVSGMSYDAVGRVVSRSVDSVRRGCMKGGMVTGAARALLDNLPEIPNTLQLIHHEHTRPHQNTSTG